jgi:hypothetical protein
MAIAPLERGSKERKRRGGWRAPQLRLIYFLVAPKVPWRGGARGRGAALPFYLAGPLSPFSFFSSFFFLSSTSRSFLTRRKSNGSGGYTHHCLAKDAAQDRTARRGATRGLAL